MHEQVTMAARCWSRGVRPFALCVSLGVAVLAAGCAYGPRLASGQGKAASLSVGEFPAVEQKVLNYVGQRTRLPVMAPTLLISERPGQFSMTAVATPASYDVQVYRTKASLPLNSPKISEPPNTGLASDVGGYSGRKFRSVALAKAGLITSTGFFARPPRSGLQKVSLGLGITGQAWTASAGDAVLLWNQGGWTLEVNSEPLVMLAPYARGLVEYLHRHPLPNYHGIVAIQDAGDGEHTLVCWRRGNDVYTVGDYHVARDAFAMAQAIRLCSSRRSPGNSGRFTTTASMKLQPVRAR